MSDAPTEIETIRDLCEATLRANWREGERGTDGARFAYTSPSPGRYPFQWYWDSCFAAMVWRRFDPARARAELESLLAAQREDGFIGHTIFWDGALNLRQRLTYNVSSQHAAMTSTIQPPVLAWAWSVAVGDPAGVPAIERHYDWLARHRDLDGDGLIWIIQPDESGLDASPQFDAIWRTRADGLPGFLVLVYRNRRREFDLRRVAADGKPVCCEVVTNVLYALSLMALGRPSLTGTIVERMYDEQAGLFRPLARPAPRREPTVTWASLAPLALPDLPDAIATRLIEEHLLDAARFWTPVPPPSVPVDDPKFSRKESTLGIRRYWRGPTWVNSAWLLWLGLIRTGYREQADALRDRIVGAVLRGGLREYYDPFDGRGMGATGFAWSTLVMEMLEPDPLATTSLLPRRAQA
ncbi:MAG TPA: hypothetical protein VFW29_11595 [Solirubrobacteraceae bacterium]|nr:hypothetical protein [Solirubrobacteraceae bacterium]